MPVYVVAQLRFRDRTAYDRYQARFMEVFVQFAGRVLASDEHPQVVEGDWQWTKVVILSFPNEPAFRIWHESPEYQQIAHDRRIGAEEVVLLVHGLPSRGPETKPGGA